MTGSDLLLLFSSKFLDKNFLNKNNDFFFFKEEPNLMILLIS